MILILLAMDLDKQLEETKNKLIELKKTKRDRKY